MPGERIHEIGRDGAVRAKALLERLLGRRIDLPFNAYDHAALLTFDDPATSPTGHFTFDLRGVLRRPNPRRFDGEEVVELLVEVKSASDGSALLGQYREFLRRAAVTSTLPAHSGAWFIFIAAAPFGVNHGIGLWDGTLLDALRPDWPRNIAEAGADLARRSSVLMATESLEQLLTRWGLPS